jgi:hypothetical protein
MKDRKTLTKSLHTITAVVNVALHLSKAQTRNNIGNAKDALHWVSEALDLLGQPGPWDVTDETVQRCVAALLKKVGK